MKRSIGILKIGYITPSFLVKLKKNLQKSFKKFDLSIKIILEALPLEKADYNQEKGQYKASKILNKIEDNYQNSRFFRILGVIDEDIYSRALNFVFGLAKYPKNRNSEKPVVALISIARLKETFYNRIENPSLFELRILKEAIHEIGHTFSLEHCSQLCIMKFSNSLADTDKKPPIFCDICHNKLNKFFKSL
ncbi:MAG: archaemetzincin family Zn-dependent metalloprotease [Promethearchaeota archaeon]